MEERAWYNPYRIQERVVITQLFPVFLGDFPLQAFQQSTSPVFLTEVIHMWDCGNQNPKSQREFSQSLFDNSCEVTDKSLESAQRLHEAC